VELPGRDGDPQAGSGARPAVRKLSFTGSTEVGRVLLAEAAEIVVSSSMELGGDAPFVVLPGADVDAAVDGALVAKMRNGGSGMVAVNRAVLSDPAAPFGGMKQSGLGREGSSEGILEFLEEKYIGIDLL
jgi:acyl-CoA reductase-like NAD-dependent aldehyde dehydrogenase